MSAVHVSRVVNSEILVIVQYVLAMNDRIPARLRRSVLRLDSRATVAKWPQANAVPYDGEGVDAGFISIAAIVGES